jgi:hypothetical protein
VKASKLIKKLNRRKRDTVEKAWGKGDRVENPRSGRMVKELTEKNVGVEEEP